MKAHVSIIAMAVALIVSSPLPAAAYLDPGTGSMVLQIAVGGILSILAAAKLYWRRIARRLNGPKGDAQDKSRPSSG
jgi:hypothetical protein